MIARSAKGEKAKRPMLRPPFLLILNTPQRPSFSEGIYTSWAAIGVFNLGDDFFFRTCPPKKISICQVLTSSILLGLLHLGVGFVDDLTPGVEIPCPSLGPWAFQAQDEIGLEEGDI